jgi:hypothetical protein
MLGDTCYSTSCTTFFKIETVMLLLGSFTGSQFIATDKAERWQYINKFNV